MSTAPDRPAGNRVLERVAPVLRRLGSMRMGIVLLAFLAMTSALATLHPMERAIRDIYTSWWYLGAAGLLAANLLACSAARLLALVRRAGRPPAPADTARLPPMSACWCYWQGQPWAVPPASALPAGGWPATASPLLRRA
ncbi:MAG TPA: cytochrome c biogenesis protein ResB [Bacillota bacterium]|nr:cytochrome c biogenesis protein ResB [Bacillota bacterium]